MLLALSVMLRPSDIAPRSQNIEEDVLYSNKFSREWLYFDENYLEIYLFGIKNDYKCTGFRVQIPWASEGMVCPVQTLQVYLQKTKGLVQAKGPVFLMLCKPYVGLVHLELRLC